MTANGQQQLLGMATQLGLDLPHSRGQESEADVLGLELMARAGYNPRAALSLWQKMQKASQGEPPKFLSTHPSSADRMTQINAINDDIREIYAEAKGNGFDKTILGKLVLYVEKRQKDASAVAESDTLFDIYLNAFDGSHAHAHARDE